MKILVLGATGFVGPRIVAVARAAGHEVLGTRRDGGEVLFQLETDSLAAKLGRFFVGDEPPIVVCCAALTAMDRCLLEKELSHRINVDSTLRVLREAYALGAKIVFFSTSAIYAGTQGYYDEAAPRAPTTEYGRQKARVEEVLEREMPSACIMRLEKLFGDEPAGRNAFADWYRAMQRGEPIQVIAGNLFSPTFVDDVARATLVAAERNLSGVFNVTNSEFFYREELARQFLIEFGMERRIEIRSLAQEEFHFADPRPLRTYLDGTKFARASGMRFTSMKEVMRSFRRRLGLRARE